MKNGFITKDVKCILIYYQGPIIFFMFMFMDAFNEFLGDNRPTIYRTLQPRMS